MYDLIYFSYKIINSLFMMGIAKTTVEYLIRFYL